MGLRVVFISVLSDLACINLLHLNLGSIFLPLASAMASTFYISCQLP